MRRLHVILLVVLVIASGCGTQPQPSKTAHAPSKSWQPLDASARAETAIDPATTTHTATTISIAAASSLQVALDEVIREFQSQHSDIEVKVTYGSSGNFFAQLSNEAPFDMFFSADVEYPQKLIAQGQAEPGSDFEYAIGQIVVWVTNESPLTLESSGMDLLLDTDVKKIAIANPRHAPYGRAAEAALRSQRIYDQVADRLVFGENVAQTAQFVESGAADVGIIAYSLATAPAMKGNGRFWIVPADSYPKLAQSGVILSWAADKIAAESFRDFIIGEQGRSVLKRHGFQAPGE